MTRFLIRGAAAATIAATCALSTGCRSVKPQPVNTVEPAIREGDTHYISDSRIITDPMLHKMLSISPPNTAWTPEGLLMVQLQLANLTNEMESVEYRFEWTDENGMLFQTPASRWIPIKLKPRDSQLVQGIAPNPRVRDFIFKVNIRRLTPNKNANDHF